jgi:hypothetical protein
MSPAGIDFFAHAVTPVRLEEGKAGDYLGILAEAVLGRRTRGLMPCHPLAASVDVDRSREIQATFERIQRPLQWPLGDFRRKKFARAGEVGFRFSRVRGSAVAGFVYGFALRPEAVPGVLIPPEAVAYAFVRPVGSDLYEELVTRPRSPVRKLVADSRSLGYPFEFHPDKETVAVRHRSFARVPCELFAHGAADFFMIAQHPLRVGGFIDRVKRATTRRGP